MKKSLIALILLVGIATISFAESRTISLGNPERMITITKNDYEKLELEIRLPEIISKDVETEKGMFSNLVIPNTYYIGEIGTPKLPALKKLIEVPFGAEVSVQVDDYSISEFALSEFGITNPIIPVQPSLPKSVDATTVEFAFNEQAYQKDQFIETKLATVEVLGVLRGARLARLVVAPVSYNPATGNIRVMNNIKISVNFSGSDPEKTEYIKAATYSPYFDVVYDRILNSKDHDYPDHPDLTRYPVKYLIVSDPMFEDQLQPFIEWKTKKGFEVIVGYTDEIGSSFNNIQTWIHDHYNAGTPEDPAPSFVLLVGDTGQIPAQTGSTTSRATDLYYCSVDGDYFPEMYYGRFSASNPNQLQPQIDRTLYYEQYQFAEPAYLDDVTLIAGADGTWNPKIGQPTVLYGTQNYFNPSYGFDEVHAYLTNYSGCYDTIDDGISLINYTAHGSETSWGNPYMGQSDVNNLVNVGKYPLAIGNCCLSGDFGYSECFGETWLRATHNTTGEPTGAIGYIGSAPSSYWFEDFYWAVGAFPIQGDNDGYVPTYDETSWGAYDAPFMSNYVTQDAILFVGNLAVTEAHVQGYPTHVSYGPIYYWQAYNLLGDPSIVPYLTQGEENDVSFAGMLPIGAESFTVSAEPGSYVAISMNGVLHGAALVDESGTVDVPIEPFAEAGEADIVVTKPQYQPVLTTVTVAVPAEVNIEPANIPVNIETEVTISVYEDDGTTPIPNVNIQANGLGVFGEVQEGITDDTGTCTLIIGSLYGGDTVILVGWREGDGYNLFEEILPVTGGASFTNPDLTVTTEVGLTDTFAMNLPGTIQAECEEEEITLWARLNQGDYISTTDDSLEFTPDDVGNVQAIISKSGYNLYEEIYPVIIAYGTVAGTVTNTEGDPLSGVEVRFYNAGAIPDSTAPIAMAETNPSGIYEISEELPVDYYDIYIEEFGFMPYQELNYFLAYGENEHDIMLEPSLQITFNGRIYDENGPVTGSKIVYSLSDTGEPYDTVDVPMSRYSASLPIFTYDVYVSCPGHVPFRGELEVNEELVSVDYELGIAALFSDFEEDDGEFSPTPSTNAWEWGEPTAGGISAYSGINLWATNLDGYYGVDNADWYLDSPSFTVPDSGRLYFYHYYHFEGSKGEKTLYDGGNVKLSINEDPFTLITPVGGYDGNITGLGEPGFGGTSNGWEQVEFDLEDYVGEEVILRWHFGSDASVNNYYGWYIDDVLVGDPTSSSQYANYNPDSVPSEPQSENIFALYQNYPNPVADQTTIRFALPTNIHKAELSIYNIKGQLVKRFELDSGSKEPVKWDTTDMQGKPVANGIYFYKLSTEKAEAVKKMIVIR